MKIQATRKQWIKFIVVLVLYLIFLLWLKSWLGLVVIPFLFDAYITKKIPWTWWKKSKNKAVVSIMSWVDAIVFALVAVYFVNLFFFQNYVIPSSSLEKSLLVGDYLLATSLANAALSADIRLVDLVAHLGQTLSEGEIIQLSNTNASDFSEEVYFEVIRKKTAALFASAAKAGALSAGSSDEKAQKAALFGELIGVAFQIKDDIFDYYASDELGKPTGNDMREGKLTLPALYVLNSLKDEAMMALALKIRALEANREEIAHFIEYVKVNGGIEYTTQVMIDYRNKALEMLPETTSQELKDALTSYIDYVIERKK